MNPDPQDNFENRLRAALQPVEPSEGFADRVMTRIAADAVKRARMGASRWFVMALAASLVAAIVVGEQWQRRQEQAGIEARRQLLEALRVTREKLDLAYQVVNSEARSPSRDAGS